MSEHCVCHLVMHACKFTYSLSLVEVFVFETEVGGRLKKDRIKINARQPGESRVPDKF